MRRLLALGAVVAMLALGGCASRDPLANAVNAGTVSTGNGAVIEFAADHRGAALDFATSDTTDGSTVSTDALRGHVVVVNFWYASCPPCRREAPTLAKLATAYADKGVKFVGVNVYDAAAVANAFDRTFGITYPNVLDVDTATVRLAFGTTVPPNTTPTTIVLDTQGRVAARVSGAITDASILEGLLDSTLAEAKS